MKKLLLAIVAFAYTWLYVLALDSNIWIFDLLAAVSDSGLVKSSDMTTLAIALVVVLHLVIVLLVIFNFRRMEGNFFYIYLASLLGSFFLPLGFTSLTSASVISFPWYVAGSILAGLNLAVGSAMAFLLSYLIVKAIRRKND